MPEDPKSFITKLKSKYPAYRDIPDDILLSKVTQKYPQYRDVANSAFGAIKRPSPLQEGLAKAKAFVREKGLATTAGVMQQGVETASAVGRSLYPATAAIVSAPEEVKRVAGEAFSKTMEPLQRPYRAVEAVAAGKNPIEALVKSTEQPSFGGSAANALIKYGVKDPKIIELVGGTAGTALELLLGSLPLTGRAPIAAKALQKIGVEASIANKASQEIVSKMPVASTPAALRSPSLSLPSERLSSLPSAPERTSLQDVTSQTSKIFDQYKLNQISLEEAQKQVKAISKIEKDFNPEERLRMIKMQHQKLQIQQRQQSTRERFSSMTDEQLVQAKTEGEQKLEQIANLKEVLRTRAIKVADNEYWKGVYSGITHNLDNIDTEVSKRSNTFFGQEGSVYVPSATEALTNLHGTAIKSQRKLGKLARNVGVPHMVGEFHPEFKPVFWGLHNGAGQGHEKWLDALDLLGRKEQFALPAASKTRLANLFRITYDQGRTSGNMPRFSVSELQGLKATPEEIKAYNSILDYNDFVGNVQIEKLRSLRGFDKVSEQKNANNPEYLKELQKFNAEIEQAVKSRGPGYFSTKRLTGDWVVYRPEPDYFFNRFETKFAAEQKAKNLPGSKTFLAEEVDPNLSYGFSSNDLESLISDTGLSKNSPEMQALLKELNSRTVASYWIEKQFKEGFDFNWDNIMEVALDYGARVTSSYGRSLGTKAANAALSEASGRMSPQLNAYARNLIDSYGVGGGRNWSTLSRIIYTSELALDTKNAVINFVAQPIQTLLPDLANYFEKTAVDKQFIKYNNQVNDYLINVLEGKPSKLDFRTQGILTQLGREGELGKRVYRQMMGMHGMRNEHISDFLGSFQTGTEFRNRALAAITYADIGQSKLGIKTFPELYQFTKQKVAFTNYLYDYYNKPMILQKAKTVPIVGPALNTMYIFRHYLNNYVHSLAYQTMKGKPEAAIRSWTNLMAMGGLKGLPLAAITGMVYAKATGKTPEYEMRKVMTDGGIPPEFQELLITGLPSLGGKGVDVSMSAGLGDILPSYGDMFENIVGVSASATRRILTGVNVFLETGDVEKASEYAPMKVIRSVVKSYNALKRGVTTRDGTQVIKVTPLDAFWMATGFTPASLSKAYAERQAKTAFTSKLSNDKEIFARRLAMARSEGNVEKVVGIRREARKAGIKVSSEAVRNWRNKFRGRQERPAREVRRRVRMIEKAFA